MKTDEQPLSQPSSQPQQAEPDDQHGRLLQRILARRSYYTPEMIKMALAFGFAVPGADDYEVRSSQGEEGKPNTNE